MDHLQGRCSCQGDGAEVLCQCGHQYCICICIFFSFLFVFSFSSIRNLAFVDKKIDKRIEKEIKAAASGSEGSSVFHDIGEKRFELRFPGAVAHVEKNSFDLKLFLKIPGVLQSAVLEYEIEGEEQTSGDYLSSRSSRLNFWHAVVSYSKSLKCCGQILETPW